MMFSAQRWPRRVEPGQQSQGVHPFSVLQTKNTIFICGFVAVACFIFFAPAYYFLSQNFSLFKELSFDTQPQLVRHLEREMLFIRGFMGLSLFFLLVSTFWFISKITRGTVKPLVAMEAHMQHLLQGQWNEPHLQSADNIEVRQLAMTYDYLHRSLQVNTEMELQLLEKIQVDPNNREAFAAWKNLIEMKRQRLGFNADANFTPLHEAQVISLPIHKTVTESQSSKSNRKVS